MLGEILGGGGEGAEEEHKHEDHLSEEEPLVTAEEAGGKLSRRIMAGISPLTS